MIQKSLVGAFIAFAISSSIFLTGFADRSAAPHLRATLPAVEESPALSKVIEAARVKYHHEKGVLEGIIFVESRFDEKARNEEKALCARMGWPAEECESRGLMGVVYGFHKEDCKLTSPEDLFDYNIAVDCGALVLRLKLDSVKRFRKSRKGQTIIVRAQPDLMVGIGLYNGDVSGAYAVSVLRYAKFFVT